MLIFYPVRLTGKAYDKAREIGIPVYSDATLAEFAETFVRPKFDKYILFEHRLAAIKTFERTGQNIRVFNHIDICRDPKDNKYLELAIEANAACIISGDKDLLVLNPFQQIPILIAVEFLKQFS